MRPDNFSLQRATNVQYVDMLIDERIDCHKGDRFRFGRG